MGQEQEPAMKPSDVVAFTARALALAPQDWHLIISQRRATNESSLAATPGGILEAWGMSDATLRAGRKAQCGGG